MRRLAFFVGGAALATAALGDNFCTGWNRAEYEIKKVAVKQNVERLSSGATRTACLESHLDDFVEWTDTACGMGLSIERKIYAQMFVDKARELCG